jgi:lysophospholipase L1-like esterase
MLTTSTTILFQGDSITNAFRKPEELCNAYQLGAGYALLVSAQLLGTHPEATWTIHNRGVSGEGVSQLSARWQADCLDLRPDVLSLLVGVNDAAPLSPDAHPSVDAYATGYRALLTQTREALPRVRFVLMEPFLFAVGDIPARAIAMVAEEAAVVRTLAAEFDAVLVPLQQVFADALRTAPAAYWSYDGIHPNAQGHWLIAQAWLRAVEGA